MTTVPPTVPATTPVSAIDQAVAGLASRASAWAALPAAERAAFLAPVRRGLRRVAPTWIASSLAAKGGPHAPMAEAEEWLYLTTVLRGARLLEASLGDIATHGRPRLPRPVRQLPSGQLAVDVFPGSWLERLVYRGMVGEVWLQPGVGIEDLHGAAAQPGPGEVAAVLGAGNAAMLPAIDVLHQLFVERRVVALKPSPINAYLGPLLEEAFGVLTRAGFLRVVYGGADEGAYLCRHPAVDHVHLTGSHGTFRALVGEQAGPGGPPALAKPVTSELGNVSPVIVVPGPWNRADIERQATRIATWLVANAGFGCLTPRVLVQHRTWPLRARLLDAVGQVLARVEPRPAYYPGAAARFARFIGAHPEARMLGRGEGARLPWGLIGDVDPAARDDVCFREEAFCGLIAETALPAADAAGFVREAAAFANATLWGTLNATLLVHPRSLADRALAAALHHAVADLRYGTVTVNSAAFAAYYLQVLPWGAFPPAEPGAIESGCGRTANSLMLHQPAKSVLRGPFGGGPDPLTVSARRPDLVARRLAAFEASPGVTALPGLGVATLRAAPRPRRAPARAR